MTEKTELHKRNRHSGEYDFMSLISSFPPLEKFVKLNKYGTLSVDFFNPSAVKSLNKALLIHYYGISYWDIPTGALCPPVPGRADYIHYISDLLGAENMGAKVRCLDIGVGANCIFPIIGVSEYGWTFVASDINLESISNTRKIIENNEMLRGNVEVRLQVDCNSIFKGIVVDSDFFDVTICNPPFHNSKESAERGTLRKLSNLKGRQVRKSVLNFGGTDSELWCEGGELRFIINMIKESRLFSENCRWFTTLVSKEDNLYKLYKALEAVNVREYKTINMQQGNKLSRILAWRFI